MFRSLKYCWTVTARGAIQWGKSLLQSLLHLQASRLAFREIIYTFVPRSATIVVILWHLRALDSVEARFSLFLRLGRYYLLMKILACKIIVKNYSSRSKTVEIINLQQPWSITDPFYKKLSNGSDGDQTV